MKREAAGGVRTAIAVATVLAAALLAAALAVPRVVLDMTREEYIQSLGDPAKIMKAVAADVGIDKQVLWNLAVCESGMRHDGIYGDNGRAYGLMQFHRRTFDWFKKMAGRESMRIENMYDQIVLAAWAIKNGFGEHWTCFRKNAA